MASKKIQIDRLINLVFFVDCRLRQRQSNTTAIEFQLKNETKMYEIIEPAAIWRIKNYFRSLIEVAPTAHCSVFGEMAWILDYRSKQ